MGTRYTTEQVARLFHLSVERLRKLQRSGVLPASILDGRRRFYSFQDLVAVRTYVGLLASGLEAGRVHAALGQLRKRLPEVTHPLRELRVWSDGRRVIVARADEGGFDGESGQCVMDFDVEGLSREVVARLEPSRARPRRAEDWFEQGCRLEDQGDFAGAESALLQALETEPHHVPAMVNLGNLRYRTGDIEGARRLYEQVLAVAPDRPEGYYNVGFLLLDAGDARAAIPLFHAAIDRDPEFPDAHFNLALAYERIGRKDRARQFWRRCIELDPAGPCAEEARDQLQQLDAD